MYRVEGDTIIEVEHPDKDYRDYKNFKTNGNGSAQRNGYRYSFEETGFDDPIEFQHKAMMNQSLPIGLRIAIAQNIAPYCHPKLGLLTISGHIEAPIDVPDFQTIEDAESFLLNLSRRAGVGELPMDSVNDIVRLIQAWIHSRRQGEELELKKLAANSSTGNHTIRIEGGLPELPGTNIIMPELDAKPAIEASPADLTPVESIPAKVERPEGE
jgi:hypothetical protein